MNILYIVFGNRTSYYIQVHLPIRSFLKQIRGGGGDNIFVITTNPEYFSCISNIHIISVSRKTIDEWEGEKHFFWRVKIKAIEYMANKYPCQHLLYLDSDTVLTGNIAEIKETLDKGVGIMHLDEGHPKDMHTKSLRMWRKVDGMTYGNITLGLQHNMWNAGVVGIPSSKLSEVAALALTICDGMLADEAERVVIEQYSLSIALFERCGLVAGRKWITHYWGNKEQYNQMAMEFFAKSYLTGRDLDGELRDFDSLPIHSTPIHIKKSNTQRRLTNVIKKLFPNKIIE